MHDHFRENCNFSLACWTLCLTFLLAKNSARKDSLFLQKRFRRKFLKFIFLHDISSNLLQVSFIILFWPSRSAVSCESGASKASGTGSVPLAPLSRDRVGPNKITDETWGKPNYFLANCLPRSCKAKTFASESCFY